MEEEDDFVDASVVDTAAVAATEAADLSSVVVSPLFGNRIENNIRVVSVRGSVLISVTEQLHY